MPLLQEDDQELDAPWFASPEDVFHHARVKHGARLISLARTNRILDDRALFKQQSLSAARLQFDSPRGGTATATLAADKAPRSSVTAGGLTHILDCHHQPSQRQEGASAGGAPRGRGPRPSSCSAGDEDEESAVAADPAAVLLKQATGCVAEMLYQLRRSTAEEAAEASAASGAAAAAETSPGLAAAGRTNWACAPVSSSHGGPNWAQAAVAGADTVAAAPLVQEPAAARGGGVEAADGHPMSRGGQGQSPWVRITVGDAEGEADADLEEVGASPMTTSSSASFAAAMGITFPHSPSTGGRSIGGRGDCSSRFVVPLQPSRRSSSIRSSGSCGGGGSAVVAAGDCDGRWCEGGPLRSPPSPPVPAGSPSYRYAGRSRRSSLPEYSGLMSRMSFVEEPRLPQRHSGIAAGARAGASSFARGGDSDDDEESSSRKRAGTAATAVAAVAAAADAGAGDRRGPVASLAHGT
ncbi:hypothetical protein HXX76_000133 [Chlamydomonas incerta]|uniref:Uncharacterized protein n=1 Tax=Chlamydomonas incerta TaxID=51695 RepID=A0A835WDS9_CHLIN|nr:hypothetical protein HXX76_000133 [Chlamydomonas incerta]|eukprot:KAG2445518.1 hypothetical protein HXX76_000133 [Chlamydomonas incerta]